MNSVSRNTFKLISVLAAICVFQVYVLAGATTPNVATNPNTTSNASGLMLGRLMLPGTESILVNGYNANSGTTILSGAQLQTPTGVNATVQLGSAGKLYISPDTNLTVTFDRANVDVKVAAGSAYVAVNAGVMSSVTSPNGKTSVTGTAPAAPAPGMSNEKKAAIIIPVVIAAVVIIYVLVRDDDSPS